MKCKDAMTERVECISPLESARDAAQVMRDEDVGFLPVCDESMRVVGAITDRDLALRILADAESADTAVGQIMTNEVVACRPDDDLSVAEALMAEHQKSRVLCVDAAGHLVGVISVADIAHNEEAASLSKMLRQMKAA